jgi:adenylate cyclase
VQTIIPGYFVPVNPRPLAPQSVELCYIGLGAWRLSETRKLAAILCSDVVGFSRLAGADEDRTLARLRALRSDLIDPTISVHNGRVVKRTGDGSIVEFRSIVDAVRCAIEIQNAMVERNAGVAADRQIVFRIGIHLGDVVEESDGDLMGDGVNIAARLEGIAAPGTICLSEDAYRQVIGRLDLKVTDLGPTRLKNIAQPVRAYSLKVGIPVHEKSRPSSRGRTGVLAAVVILAAAGAAAAYLFVINRPVAVSISAPTEVAKATTLAPAARLSVVVLPFANLSGDPAQDYFADVLTEELTTGLARIRGSFVIARNTAFTYKGKQVDVKAVGRDLGVRYVLEGSVQPSGSQVRVNAQLIDADSGAHLWAEQFDTGRANLLQTQDEIVAHLARSMEIQLTGAEAARLTQSPAANPDAEDWALRCQAAEHKARFVGKEAQEGFKLCEQALQVDPNNVRALAHLSIKFWLPVVFGSSASPEADLKKADEMVARALLADPAYATAHLQKAWILWVEGRLDEAVAENERALALDPSMVDAYGNLGADYLDLGQFEKSIESFDKAIRLSPHDINPGYWDQQRGRAYIGLRQYEQAIESERRSLAINPNHNPYAHADIIAAFALTGRDAEARESLARYLALPPFGPRTIAEWRSRKVQFTNPRSDPRYVELWDRIVEGLRKAGMPEA